MKRHEDVELDEVQGIVLNGYASKPAARFMLFQIIDPKAARRWIGSLVERRVLQFGEYRRTLPNEEPHPNDFRVNLAFTHEGLSKLGLPRLTLDGFSLPFQEGAANTDRARRLGDDQESAPGSWQWGGANSEPVHGVVLCYAGARSHEEQGEDEIDAWVARELVDGRGVAVVRSLPSHHFRDKPRFEHFGFRDGISNPRVGGVPSSSDTDVINAGEFILGYKNGNDKLPISPEVDDGFPSASLLPRATSGRRDFGRNGSYLVFRQLEQKVHDFWSWIRANAQSIPGAPAGDHAFEWLAAKVVGRFRGGAPLAVPGPHEHHVAPLRSSTQNDFDYGHDVAGDGCPFGAHIRRSNPRGTLLPIPHDADLTRKQSVDGRVKLSNLHRILRRGRAYGPPIDEHFSLEGLSKRPEVHEERGLYFLALNANIQRQFEFVQTNWVLNPTFAGMAGVPDPLLGGDRMCPVRATDFAIPGAISHRVGGLRRFVETRGGGYFFVPSRAALKFIGAIGT